jgi:hypothetical protein
VVDPDKFDYYAMVCYRLIGDNKVAELNAQETLRKSIARDGTKRVPMCAAEAELTLGVVAARRSDLHAALDYGHSALAISWRSQPSLLIVGAELADAVEGHYPSDDQGRDFCDALPRLAPFGAASARDREMHRPALCRPS